MTRTLLESSLGRETTAVVVSSGPSCSVTYRCRERFHKENVQSKSCYVFAEASGRTEPSEHVLGMEELRFSKPVQAEQKVHGRPAREPVEAISGSNTTNSAIEVGRTSEVYAVKFTCQYPEPLPHFSNRHILLLY